MHIWFIGDQTLEPDVCIIKENPSEEDFSKAGLNQLL